LDPPYSVAPGPSAGLALAVVFAAVISRRATHLVPAVSALLVSPSSSAQRRRRGAFLGLRAKSTVC